MGSVIIRANDYEVDPLFLRSPAEEFLVLGFGWGGGGGRFTRGSIACTCQKRATALSTPTPVIGVSCAFLPSFAC